MRSKADISQLNLLHGTGLFWIVNFEKRSKMQFNAKHAADAYLLLPGHTHFRVTSFYRRDRDVNGVRCGDRVRVPFPTRERFGEGALPIAQQNI